MKHLTNDSSVWVLTRAVSEIYEELTSLGAEIEVGLDFPEEDVPYIADESLAGRLEIVRQSLADLLERCSSGVILLSLGRHSPRAKISIPTSCAAPSSIYALLRALPLPLFVMNGCSR